MHQYITDQVSAAVVACSVFHLITSQQQDLTLLWVIPSSLAQRTAAIGARLRSADRPTVTGY